MKNTVTSSKRCRACTAILHVSNPSAGHCQPMPLPKTPGHSRASLGQSLVGSLLLSPGSWFAQSFVCALQESVSPVLCKFWRLCGGLEFDCILDFTPPTIFLVLLLCPWLWGIFFWWDPTFSCRLLFKSEL